MPAATAFATIGWKYYLVFIIVPACGLPVIFKLPETRGLSLEEIAALFGDEVAMDLSQLRNDNTLDSKVRGVILGDVELCEDARET